MDVQLALLPGPRGPNPEACWPVRVAAVKVELEVVPWNPMWCVARVICTYALHMVEKRHFSPPSPALARETAQEGGHGTTLRPFIGNDERGEAGGGGRWRSAWQAPQRRACGDRGGVADIRVRGGCNDGGRCSRRARVG